MYISPRTALIRNLSASLVNGSITLIILLIAPLGIMAVVINTLLITIATFAVHTVLDRVILFLQRDYQQAGLGSENKKSAVSYRSSSKLGQRR